METPNPRSSERVKVEIPIQLIGSDATGQHFFEQGVTTIITRRGAAIRLTRKLAQDQELIIRNMNTNKDAEARLVGMISQHESEVVYGMALLDPNSDLWDVQFTESFSSDEVVLPTPLRCGECEKHEVIYLRNSDIELQVFEANKSIQRFCRSCSATTAWKTNIERDFPDSILPKNRAAKKLERRDCLRVTTKMSACIRRGGLPDEVVACMDISRGGVSFISSRPYRKQLEIQIAVPYMPNGSGNIFVPGRIVHVVSLGNQFQYGVEYIEGGFHTDCRTSKPK
jgi:hypothetical protein